MKRLFLILLLSIVPALAQNSPKLVTVKYADPQSVARLLSAYGVDMRVDQRLKVIALSGPKEQVALAEEAIKQLDVPPAAPKDLDLTAYFVTASNNPQLNSGNPIPPDLQSVVSTLKTTFPFQSYLLMDVLALRAASGTGAETSGRLPANKISTFSIRNATVEADGSTIRLDHLHAGVKIPHEDKNGLSYIDTGLSTDLLNIKDGQTLVVGRTSLQGPDQALFLILIAHVAK